MAWRARTLAIAGVMAAAGAVVVGSTVIAHGKSAPAPAAASKKARAHVTILATGGTIAGAQAAPGEYGYKAGSVGVESLIKAVPQLGDLAEIDGQQVMNIGSQDMTNADWLQLARRIDEVERTRNDVNGIVVTHGTDTMEETSYFIDLTVPGEKPIVFVGSMRPATAISADGPMNLYNAVAVAAHASARGCGALVVMNDKIDEARNVYKTDTTTLDTFVSVDRGPLGTIDTGHADFFHGCRAPRKTLVPIRDIKALPSVYILYAYANMGRDLIDAAVANGANGLVIAGVGDGNMTKVALEGLKAAQKRGVVIVRSTRVSKGLTLRNNEIDDDQFGFVAASEFKPSKARVLLLLALLKSHEPREIQRIFDSY